MYIGLSLCVTVRKTAKRLEKSLKFGLGKDARGRKERVIKKMIRQFTYFEVRNLKEQQSMNCQDCCALSY